MTVGSPPASVPARRRGRRERAESLERSGAYVRSRVPTAGFPDDIALDATLRAATLAGPGGDGVSGARVRVRARDVREKVRVQRAGRSILFVVDASGSMRARQRMIEAKTAVVALLQDAHHKRDRVGLVAFRGERAEAVLPFTQSVDQARRMLDSLASGGKTPLAEGLRLAFRLVAEEVRRLGDREPVLVVLSDGKPTWARSGDPLRAALRAAQAIRRAGIPAVFLDTDTAEGIEPGCGHLIARAMGGQHLDVGEVRARRILEIVRAGLARCSPPPYRRRR